MKKIIIEILVSLITILMAGIGYGAAGIDKPDTDEYVKGTYYINGTPSALGNNITNITLDYRISGAGTYTLIGYNMSDNNITSNWNYSTGFNTIPLKDDTTYSLRARYGNASGVLETATEVQFKVDNTIPVLTSLLPSDGSEDSDGSVDFSLTCANASLATLYIESIPYTMAESSDACTLTVSSLRNSLQSWYIVGSDGLNTTTSSTNKVEIRKGGGVIIQNGQVTTGATQITTTAQKSTGINGLLNDIIQLPVKLLTAIFNIIGSIFK